MPRFLLASLLCLAPAATLKGDEPAKPLRAGIIGCDTSHVIAFTSLLNKANKAPGPLADVRVVAAFPGGSPDLPASRDRVAGYVKDLRDKYDVEIVDSIAALLPKVDVVLLESVDGRPHLEQVKPVLKARKPVFIDKPVAGSLADAVEIFRLAKEAGVPVFSSSSLRFSPGIQAVRKDPKLGDVLGCAAYGPCSLEPHHPDLFWYGVHGVETLFTVMGTGCESVSRVQTADTELVTGVWKGGRVGTFRGIRKGKSDYGALVFGSKAILPSGGYGGYQPLVVEICKFFKTGKPPVSAEETIEIFTFMEAADESKRRGGAPVKLADVLAKARHAQAPADLKGKVHAIVDNFNGGKKPVGLVVGVLPRAGEPCVFGYGKVARDSDRVPDGDTIFEIGSVTKVFTALLLADAVRRGEAKLDDPVRLYLPADVVVPKRGDREITLLDLATHSSGLPAQQPLFPVWVTINGDIDNPWANYTVKHLYGFLAKFELPREPGAAYEYSNWGMALLGHALACKAKTPFETLLVDRICTPLGLKDTRIKLSSDQQARFAQGYKKDGEPNPHCDFDVLAPAGALRSSANDMLKFLAANLGRPETPLSPAMHDCHQPRRPTDTKNETVGLGWHRLKLPGPGREIVWHNGGTFGFHSMIAFDPDGGNGVVVLANSDLSIDKIAIDVLKALSARD